MAEQADERHDTFGALRRGPWPARAAWTAGYLVLLAMAGWMVHRLDGAIHDDAYIFLRYARNLAAGDGWTFFPGSDAVNGSTSPLWTLILSAVSVGPFDLEAAASFLSAACVAGAALLTFATIRSLATWWAAGCAAVLVVLNPELALDRGMESALFVLLIGAVLFACCVVKRPVLTGVLCGLLILARPDGALLVLAVGIVEWRRARRPPLAFALACVAILGAWAAFAWLTIGTPVPGTLAAKHAQGRSPYFGTYGGNLTFLRSAIDQVRTSRLLQALVVLGATGVGLGARRHPRLRTYLVLCAGSALALFLGYALVIRPPDYPWYLAGEFYALTVVAGLGIAEIASSVPRLPAPAARAAAGALAAVLLLATVMLGVGRSTDGYPYTGYDQLSSWLERDRPASDRVAISEIGVVGWRTDREVVDYLGLLTSSSVEDVERDDYRSWLDREQPELFVSHVPAFAMEADAMGTEWFPKAYRPIGEIADAPSPSQVRVFERVRSPAEARAATTMVLVTPFLRAAFDGIDVALDAEDERALDEVLARFLRYGDLQRRTQAAGGVDIGRLLDEARAAPDATPDLVRAWDDLRDRVRARGGLVTPLAPPIRSTTASPR